MIFHWGFIAVFIFALFKQLDEVDELEDLALLQYELAFASFFLILLTVRFIYMQRTRPTALPDETPRRERLLARTVHLAMYASMSLIAIFEMASGRRWFRPERKTVATSLWKSQPPRPNHARTLRAASLSRKK